MNKDKIFATPRDTTEAFRFDEQVAAVFPDMLERSIPGYTMMLEMIGIISRHYVQPGSSCYDLGCSLGAATFAIAHSVTRPDVKIIGVDNSAAMLDRCRQILLEQSGVENVELRLEDLRETDIKNASLVVMNFTLQFLPASERESLLQRIHEGINEGGVLILSEKTTEESAQKDALLIDLYHDFKASRGYSQLEIAQKRDALENVLVPESLAEHQRRLTSAGFSMVLPWFRCFNFSSLIAIK